MDPTTIKKTPLYQICQQNGARFTDFAGWWLPLQFSGMLQEVAAVRNQAGLFDVSHMGELYVTGTDASRFLNQMLTSNVVKGHEGQVIYAILCQPDGGSVDDLLVYRLADQAYLLVVNAINTQKVLAFLSQQASGFSVEITDRSSDFALLALQGPAAAAIISPLFPEVVNLKPFRFGLFPWEGEQVLLSRTGYTGEDGFEIYIPPILAEKLWLDLTQYGADYGLLPAGLGARDLLRQEAGLPLYGNELTPEISPVKAGLDRFIDWEKPAFSGRSSLMQERDNPTTPQRIGLKTDRSAIPRPGTEVYWQDKPIGRITSGTFSPTLEKGIGMALVNPIPPPGAEVSLAMRGRFYPADCVKLPFYKRKR